MPRRALASISGNIPRRKELSRYERGVVLGFAGAGVIPPKIATELNLPESTVRETLSKAPQRPQGISTSRIGRPPKCTIRDERKILRIVRTKPRITYRELGFELGLPISQSTLYRILRKYYIKK
jgi:transposase